jgi:DNA (cytosine-5)-methyltransferase 3A
LEALKVLSLFDGISCGRLALNQAGIPVSEYHAFEIDKYATAISRYNFPEIVRHGDVMAADSSMFAGFDMVLGGSPCTFWSCAKNNRRELDKSGRGWALFMAFVNAVRIVQPRWFLYENVASMPANIKAYITEDLGTEPILINSSLVSAQQRKRLYWTNIPNLTQPADKGILLKDILESGITARDKAYCIDACYYKGGNHASPHKQSGKRLAVFEPLGAELRTREDESGKYKRSEVRGDGKCNALTTVQTDSIVCAPVRIGTIGANGQGNRTTASTARRFVCRRTAAGGARRAAGCTKSTCRTAIISSAS